MEDTFKEGDKVRINLAKHPFDRKMGEIHQMAPSNKFAGVNIRGKHAGYFHVSDLKKVS